MGDCGAEPTAKLGKDGADQMPSERQVDNEHANGSLAEVPLHVSIGYEGRHKAEDFSQDGGNYDKYAETEYTEEDKLLTERQPYGNEQWHGDSHDGYITGDREDAAYDLEVLV